MLAVLLLLVLLSVLLLLPVLLLLVLLLSVLLLPVLLLLVLTVPPAAGRLHHGARVDAGGHGGRVRLMLVLVLMLPGSY